MNQGRHSEAAFETVIEAHLLQKGYVQVAREGFDRERALSPETVLAFIRETQPQEWAELKALRISSERALTRHEERRAALIATAVTGPSCVSDCSPHV